MFEFLLSLSRREITIFALAVLYALVVLLVLATRRGRELFTRVANAAFALTEPFPMPVRAILHGTVGGLIIGCLTMGAPLILLSFL